MIDKPLLSAVIILLTLSLVMSYSLSTYTVVHFHYSDFHFFIRQSMAIFIGFITMVILTKLDPRIWFIRAGFALFFTFFVLMMIMQFLPTSLVNAVGGAKRWIRLGPLSVAPVEFFKVGFIFFMAWSFSKKILKKPIKNFMDELKMFAPYLALFLFAVVLIAVFQKDLGQVVVLGVTLMVLFIFIGVSKKFLFSILGLGLGAFIVLILIAPHRLKRILSWWGTVQDKILSIIPFDVESLRIAVTKEPYQISNSLNAMHNGSFFGVGLGNGQFKLGYLSEVHTDFILGGITEEFGLVGLMFVTFTMLFIVLRIFQIASRTTNPMYYLFCIGVGLLISFAFILNAYGISGITPIKGIAVPFLSYGGSHIWASCIGVGLVLMISKTLKRDTMGRML